jgi:myo-inositol 2-dehydrogenase / D-chiro-inositol 1-dehydrogenase
VKARVACIGTGFMAGKHLGALTSFPDVEVVAVADAVAERAAEVAGGLGARAYGDGLELLRTEELDAVWLCVPPFAHGPLERAALDRDLPFFVEKPLAHDLATATAIADQVAQRGVLAAVGYHWRYLSVVETVAARCREEPPVLADGYWLDGTPGVAWWGRRGSSGGQVVEQTTHIFDLARHVVGEVEAVQADERPAVEEPDEDAVTVPAAATALLRFRSGCVGTVSSARTLPARHRVGLHLVGDGYAAELSEASLTDHALRVVDGTGTSTERTDENPIAKEDRAFVDAVLGRRDDVRAPYAEALRSHALAWTADRSAREGRSLSPSVEDARA